MGGLKWSENNHPLYFSQQNDVLEKYSDLGEMLEKYSDLGFLNKSSMEQEMSPRASTAVLQNGEPKPFLADSTKKHAPAVELKLEPKFGCA